MSPPQWGVIGSGSGANGAQVGNADNPMRRFGIETIVNQYLKNGSRWYLFDRSKVIKPMVWQVRVPAMFTPRVNEADPVVFDRHAYVWGTWGRVTPGWAYSYLLARSGP